MSDLMPKTDRCPLGSLGLHTYIAGPMSGLPNNNYPAFYAAAAKLRAEGHVVLSPAEHTETADTWAGWMRLGLAMLIQCDTIVLLPGWQESRGAKIEAKLAADLGMASCHYPEAPDPAPTPTPTPAEPVAGVFRSREDQ